MEATMTDPDEARRALESIRDARTSVLQRLENIHWGYDLAYGAVIALLVGGQGLPQPFSILTVPIALGGLAVMVRWWRAKTGIWVSGYTPRRPRWVAFGLAAILIALMLGNLYCSRILHLWWAPLAAGGAAFVLGIVFGRWWMRVYRKELLETGA
jgi:hypothetical protein